MRVRISATNPPSPWNFAGKTTNPDGTYAQYVRLLYAPVTHRYWAGADGEAPPEARAVLTLSKGGWPADRALRYNRMRVKFTQGAIEYDCGPLKCAGLTAGFQRAEFVIDLYRDLFARHVYRDAFMRTRVHAVFRYVETTVDYELAPPAEHALAALREDQEGMLVPLMTSITDAGLTFESVNIEKAPWDKAGSLRARAREYDWVSQARDARYAARHAQQSADDANPERDSIRAPVSLPGRLTRDPRGHE